MARTERTNEQLPLVRAARMVIPWVALIVIVTMVLTYFGQYRSAGEDGATGPETTATVDATATVTIGETTLKPGEPYVRVLSDGLNLRARPMTTSDSIKTFPKDELLILIEKGNGWYHVRDAAGDEGWVAAGGRYSELVE